jgi:hypothetical protein
MVLTNYSGFNVKTVLFEFPGIICIHFSYLRLSRRYQVPIYSE